MLAQYLDLTEQLNADGYASFETSNYDYAVVQIIGQSGTMDFLLTINSGAIQGVTDGNILTSLNYSQTYATQLIDGTLTTSSNSGNGLYRFNVVGRYIKIGKKGATVNKLLVMLAKIS